MTDPTWQTESLDRGGQRHRLVQDGTAISWRAWADRLTRDQSTRAGLTAVLAESPYPALYWETPPTSSTTADRPFEMVVLPSPRLTRIHPSPAAFAEHLVPGPSPVRVFANLSGDATLVVPMPDAAQTYGHLAAFVRHAPAPHADALWQAVGEQIETWWSTQRDPVWVSTAGDGVPWLHVRLDARPKYYRHRPYADDS